MTWIGTQRHPGSKQQGPAQSPASGYRALGWPVSFAEKPNWQPGMTSECVAHSYIAHTSSGQLHMHTSCCSMINKSFRAVCHLTPVAKTAPSMSCLASCMFCTECVAHSCIALIHHIYINWSGAYAYQLMQYDQQDFHQTSPPCDPSCLICTLHELSLPHAYMALKQRYTSTFE